jgi:hypothetical protein
MSDEETPYDAGDPAAVKARARTAKQRESSKRSVIRQIMSSSEGRAWIHEVLSMSHVYSSSFSTNALTMAYSEGERNIGLRITADIVSASPERYLEMLKENSSE